MPARDKGRFVPAVADLHELCARFVVDWIQMVEAERAGGWSGLAGSHIELLVPVRGPLVESIVERVRWPKPIETMSVRLLDAQRVGVSATVSVWGFQKRFDLRLRLAPALDRQNGTRRLVITIENHALLAAALAIFGPALKLPPGVAIDGARIAIDIDALAAANGFADLANHVDEASLEIREGVLWLNAAVTVKQGPVRASLRRLPHPEGANARTVTADALLDWFRGARVVWRLRVAETLANQLLAAGIDQALGAANPSNERRRLLPLVEHALRRLRVAFEQGALVVEGETRVE